MKKIHFEESLREAVKIACENDYIDLNKDTENYKHVFSSEFEKSMEELISNTKKKKRRMKKRWKYFLIAAAILILNVSVVLANAELREKIGNVFISIYEHCVELKSDLFGENASKEFEKYFLTYIPEGYKRVEEYENSAAEHQIIYKNEDNQTITFIQSYSEIGSILISNEGNSLGEKEVDGIKVKFISDGEINTIFFEKEEYVFIISVPLEVNNEELLKMVESIKKNE